MTTLGFVDHDGMNVNSVTAKTIDADNFSGATVSIIGSTRVRLASTGTGDIILDSNDTMLLDSIGVMELNSTAGRIGIGTDADAQAIDIGTGAAARTITMGNVTGATGLVLNCGTGGSLVTGLLARSTTAAAIATTRVLTIADSGGCFTVAKTSPYTITLPAPQQGLQFHFLVLDTGANVVTIASTGVNCTGTLDINNVLTAATGTNCLLASGGSIGDNVHYYGIDATHYMIVGHCIAAADLSMT